MNYKTPMQNQNKGYGKESASQERSNLLTMNPLSKHMSTPMQMGGSKMKGSAMMMKKGPGDPGKTIKVLKKEGKIAKGKSSRKLQKAKPTPNAIQEGIKSGSIKKGKSRGKKLKKADPKDFKGSPAKMGAKKGDQSKSRLDYEGSPAKNLGMKYDIKEASNQSLSKKARKHYAENAQAASKSGYKG
jgi:hypothetical protein